MQRFFSGFLVLAAMGCGSGNSDSDDKKKMGMDDASAKPEAAFSDALLADFSRWTPVLAGDQAFTSAGHGGIMVRSYLNPAATQHLMKSAKPYPLAEGSILAKAVVATKDSPATEASRVYLMRKEAEGFDTAHNNWSYAVANRIGGTLVYDKTVNPREELCVSCHAKFSAFDYVQTVDFYLKQSAGN